MAYVIVQFEENGGSISLIYRSWLTPRKQEVYWPPYTQTSVFEKALSKGEAVNYDSLKIFKLKRIFGAYDNLKEAKEKERRAETVSDLEREDFYDIDETIRRPVIRPRRLYEESDSENDEDGSSSLLPRPQKISRVRTAIKGRTNVHDQDGSTLIIKARSSRSSNPSSRANSPSSSRSAVSPHPLSSVSNSPSSSRSALSPHPQSSRTTPLGSLEGRQRSALISNSPSGRATFQSSPIGSQHLAISLDPLNRVATSQQNTVESLSNTLTNSTSKVFQTKLCSQLATIIEQNKEIVTLIRSNNNRVAPQVNAFQQPPLPVDLPLKTNEDLHQLEDHLKLDLIKQKQLIAFLSLRDRNSVGSCTNAALKYCLSYELAKECSYLGTRNNKKPFNNYVLKKIIVDAVKNAFASATERNVEDNIKHWLKRAPKSYSVQQAKQRRLSA